MYNFLIIIKRKALKTEVELPRWNKNLQKWKTFSLHIQGSLSKSLLVPNGHFVPLTTPV